MDSTITEAYGARQAVEFGLFLGIQTILLKGDALEITNSLNNTEGNAGKFGNFIADTRAILRGFGSWDVSHVKREGNRVAHALAKFVISSEQNKVWFEFYPTCLLRLVNSELILPVN
jgi:hypothetical protein